MDSDSDGATIPVGAVVIVLAILFVALRFYVRILTKAGLKWDDWLILFAVVLTVVTAAILVYGNPPTLLLFAYLTLMLTRRE